MKTVPNPKNASADPVLTTNEERAELTRLLEKAEELADNKKTRTKEFEKLNCELEKKTGYYLDGCGLSKGAIYGSIQSIADIELAKQEPSINIFHLGWNTLEIAKAMHKALKENGFKNREGKDFDDDLTFGMSDNGKSAFCIIAFKSMSVLQIYIENEEEQIRFMGGVDGKYLPEGQKKPQYKEVFKKDKLAEASKYFEEIVKIIGVTNEIEASEMQVSGKRT